MLGKNTETTLIQYGTRIHGTANNFDFVSGCLLQYLMVRNAIVVVVSIAQDKRKIMIYKVTKGATFQYLKSNVSAFFPRSLLQLMYWY
jgi:hypothetical protein